MNPPFTGRAPRNTNRCTVSLGPLAESTNIPITLLTTLPFNFSLVSKSNNSSWRHKSWLHLHAVSSFFLFMRTSSGLRWATTYQNSFSVQITKPLKLSINMWTKNKHLWKDANILLCISITWLNRAQYIPRSKIYSPVTTAIFWHIRR